MAQTRWFFESATISRTQAYPVSNTIFSYKRERNNIFYRQTPTADIRFGGASVLQSGSYNWLSLLDPEECEVVTIELEVYCSGVWVLYWTGQFTWLDIRHDADNCLMWVRPKTQDQYTCFMAGVEEKVSAFELTVVEISPYGELAELFIDCNTSGPYDPDDVTTANPPDGFPPDLIWCLPPESNYTFTQFAPDGVTLEKYLVTCYQRLVAPGTCNGAVASSPFEANPFVQWFILENNCPTDSLWWRCPGGASAFVRSKLPYGRDFKAVIELIFESCGLSVVSDFFGINPDATAPGNAAYEFADMYTKKMTLHQKSDVKRPYVSDPAKPKMWDFKRNQMLSSITIMFNVYWTITGTTVRIEHISYFDTAGGIDASSVAMANETEADVDDKIKEEVFYWMDAEAVTPYFQGLPITYDCGEDEAERRVPIISTDLSIINENNNSDIFDEGFVLVSNQENAGTLYVIRDNCPLSFTELHDALHRHYRYFKDMTINGVAATALSTRGTRRQIPFTTRLCCDDAFNPELLVETLAGFARVLTAERDISNDTVRLELKY